MKATVVTALFDIGRKDVDGRGMEQYYEWFAGTLKMSAPMVIYCDESLNSFIRENRPPGRETKIVNQKLEEVPCYFLKEKIDAVLSSEDYVDRIKDPGRIECKTSLYSIIQYSKFAWVERAAVENHFDSDYFFWMDAGISRHAPDLDLTQPLPGSIFGNQIKEHSGKVLYQMYVSPYPDLVNGTMTEDYFWDNRSFMWGGLFGVDKFGSIALKAWCDEVLQNLMINSGRMNNEQLAIGYLAKKVPGAFLILQCNAHQHRNFEIMYQIFQ